MKSVSVGGLYNKIIGIVRIINRSRVFYNRLICISHVTAENCFLCNTAFCYPNFYTRRAEQVTYIVKSYFDIFQNSYFLIIITRTELLKYTDSIVHIINRNIFFPAGTLCFSVSPFRLSFLNMRTVRQHYFA